MIPPLEEIEVDRIHESPKKKGKKSKRKIMVDMNPMVDLAFLLLTFFMLATTFSQPSAMEILIPAKPKASDLEKETPVKESKTLSLLLLKNHIVWYNGITDPMVDSVNYNANQLSQLLLKQQDNINGLVVLIKPTDESNYGNLVTVLDMMKISQIQRYAIVDCSDFDFKLSKRENEDE